MPGQENAEKIAAPSRLSELKSLVARNIQGNMQLVARVNALVKNAGQSLGPQRRRNEGKQSALLTRLLDFNLASYEIMSSCTLEMLNGLISAAEISLLGQEAATAAAAPGKVCGEIQVEVRQGERLKAPFVVENQYNSPLDISFEASDLTAATAPALPASRIAFEPAALKLDPRQKAVIMALVDISSAFVVGKTYSSTIRVIGFQGQEVRLRLTILPPAEKGEVIRSAKSAPRKKNSRTKRAKGSPASPAGRIRAARK